MSELLQDRRRALIAAVVGVVALALVGRAALRPHAAHVPPPVHVARAASGAAGAKRAEVFVDVVGAVRRPGLYRLETGARVADALARAGGGTGKAQLELVNLAALVADGEQVVVPRRGAGAGVAGSGGGGPPAGPVHLNSATVDQLDELPGVGPVTAQKIVDWRSTHGPFRSVDDLDDVPGIGPARIEQLRDLVTP